MPEGIKVVFGGGAINEGRAFGDPELAKKALDILEKGGVKNIDSAAV